MRTTPTKPFGEVRPGDILYLEVMVRITKVEAPDENGIMGVWWRPEEGHPDDPYYCSLACMEDETVEYYEGHGELWGFMRGNYEAFWTMWTMSSG